MPPVTDDSPTAAPEWRTLATGESAPRTDDEVQVRRVVLQVVGAAVVVLLLVGLLGVVVVRRMAEREALNDASQLTDQLARSVIMPALDDALLTGDPDAVARLDEVVQQRVLTDEMFVRVKVWSPEGVVLYSDEPELVGEQFTLGTDQLEVLAVPATVAEVSDLQPEENRLERDQGRLVEVYRPVWTPSGRPMLFETYTDYATVTARTGDLWRGFGGTVVSSLLLFGVLLTPLLWTLFGRLRRARQAREVLLQHAIDASRDERRRIAADLHDGVVQDLVATSLMVSGAAEQADAAGTDPLQAAQLRTAASAVRSSVASLRTLLVDIYPPTLSSAGLEAALTDLASGVRSRGLPVELELEPAAAARLSADRQRLVYRTTQECLRNAVEHSRADRVRVSLRLVDDRVELEIEDDGVGIDEEIATRGREGHFGLRLLTDLADEGGAALRLATAAGRGTRWRLELTP